MAKTERRELETTVNSSVSASRGFDVDALLKEDLSTLPNPQTLLGSWAVKWISAFINEWENAKGSGVGITINFDPIHAFSVDREEIEDEVDMGDLPRLRHWVSYTSNADKRAFRELVRKFGVEPGPLENMLLDVRGQLGVVAITSGTNKRTGAQEARLTNFRAYPEEMPFDTSASAFRTA